MTAPARTGDVCGSDTHLRVVVVDDDLLARAGLTCLLEKLDDVEVVGTAACTDDAALLADELRAEVVVYGCLPRAEIDAQPTRPVKRVVLADTDDPVDVETAFSAGSDAFLRKSRSPQHLAAAVRAVAAGARFLDPEVGARLAAAVRGGPDERQTLTSRERDILALLSEGRTNDEIADTLGISARTVEGHRTRIGKKLRLRRRAELVQYALVHGLARRRSA